ncbi:PREDICTED: uncharacterized protein LOC109465072 [Branchiostoma belcheri]|uniref:Uncharacterized protein LOC109465072 n=1 Tax=Branchiostoma belcheri TaxID=7741 RepID=A0A6P4YKW6_BRABE|nr:PREDICTED: uncharacterized protein LOC109465072 [Branchiostoma belcheri]
MLERGQAITKNGDITLRWSGWRDDDSGIGEYEYEVFKLRPFGDVLGMRGLSPVPGQTGRAGAATSQANIHLTEPGVYSIVLTVEDGCGPNDGNFVITRRFLIYDDNSTVQADTSGHYPMWAESASNVTGRVWQTDLQDAMGNGPQVAVSWPDHFCNQFHKHNKFLNAIEEHPTPILPGYEELTGQPPATRSRKAIPNVNTILLFQTDWSVDHQGGRSLSSPPGNWQNVTDMTVTQSRDVPREDGDTVRFWVRAYDVMSNFADDYVTIHVDSSPPVIEDIFLSRGGIHTLAVHHSQDLFEMTVVFIAYDDHSGLHNIHWELHDMADPTVVHGEGQVAVRRPSTLHPECPPPFCTCIPKDEECYFRNYEFSPDMYKINISQGTHDHDYYIVITVTNNAMLQTQQRFQITVDTSPPLPGHVHDSLPAETDLDFQQDTVIQASWEGFFDRESGVMFYMYGFAEDCLTLENVTEFGNTTNTTSTHAVWEATHQGLYHCTIIAFNSALEPSEPVCSDGVTIDVTPPVITDLSVDNLHYTPGVIRGKDGVVWLVDSSGLRHPINQPSPTCRNVSQEVDDVNLWPAQNLLSNGTEHPGYSDNDCLTTGSFSGNGYLSRENRLSLRWTGEDPESEIYDFEVGLSSTLSPDLPDILPFTSTNAHPHFTTYHPDLDEGKQFYLVLKAINRAQMSTTKVLGPFIVDVTPPVFSSVIEVTLEENNGSQALVARWDSRPTSVHDIDDTGKFYKFEYSVGHHPGTTEVHDFAPLTTDDKFCNITSPPTCLTIPLSALDWHLHGQNTYYVSIRVENAAGLSTVATSQPYVHFVGLPSRGVVMEVDPAAGQPSIFGRPADVDIQSSTDTISCEWLGFSHPHQDVTYQVGIGTEHGLADVCPFTYTGQNTSFTAHNMHLDTFQTYYVTVVAGTESGNISVTSDGVLVLRDDDVINGTQVLDGLGCIMDTNNTFSHHANLSHLKCSENKDFQISTTTVEARWTIPAAVKTFIRRVEWALEREVRLSGVPSWERITEFRNMRMSSHGTWTGLNLLNSHRYRSVIKFCYPSGCFQPAHSDGFTVIHNPPTPGQITSVSYNRTSRVLTFTWQQFDHEDTAQSNAEGPFIHYEWNLATEMSLKGSAYGDIVLPWQPIHVETVTEGQLTHEVKLDDGLDFTHCLRLLVRGTNRVGLYSTAARDVLDCDNPILIIPPTVIDAVGTPESTHINDVHLAQNERWPLPDQEFTSARDKLSAVWPTLRHGHYRWKVVSDESIQNWAYVTPRHALRYSDYDCSSPQVLACGETEENFVNVPEVELLHGRRYHICVHANATVLHFELFDKSLDEVDSCSNGIAVDLTPPLPGQVWVNHKDGQFQTSTSEMIVYWNAFRDVEEHGTSSHHSGIHKYEVAIGTSPNGVDVQDFMDVGVTNMATVHGLRLYSGHTYYATVRATDYVGLTVTSVSRGVTVDVTAPVVTDADVDVGGRYLLSTSSVSASWDRVFMDTESGMSYYEWCVGSQPGHCDVMALTRTESEETVSDSALDLRLQEGHAYYISVTGYNGAGLSSVAFSWAAVVETSPPVHGFVYDGVSGGDRHDVDFQTDTGTLHTWWEGFHDPHTALLGYSWSVGTCPGCDDVMEAEDVGLLQEASVEYLRLVSGKRYYVTVTACNVADLCTSVTSDGVVIDNSPPVAGIVYDGVDDMDLSFQASRTFLGAHWFGFYDPHSGLSHYEWRAGTTPGGDDVHFTSRLHLTEMAYISRVDPPLTIGQAVYVTIRAYNKAGLFVERSSNGVTADDTPPAFVSRPSFDLQHGSIIAESQMWRTIVSVSWEVSDPDSPIERQHLSVFTHHQADLDIEPLQVVGSIRDYKFTNLSLHDGNTYYVRVTACNMARLCTSAETDGLLIDSTPPTVGTFAVHTEHAAQLSRHQNGWMGYRQQNSTTPPHVRLAWLGFSDIHTGIESYHVTIGSEFSGRDLSGHEVIIPHQNGTTHEDEGVIQTASVNISRDLTPGEHVYISLWAVNKVGLESLEAHDAFEVVASSPYCGVLSLVRRCDAESCEGDCTCAPQNQKCAPPDIGCNDVTDPSTYQQVLVYDVTDLRSQEPADADVTPSQCALAARWEIIPGGKQIKRFEWSAGQFGKAPGTLLMDTINDRVWFDVGLRTRAVLSLPVEFLLQPEIKYMFHVRAWYASHEYLDFHSNGIQTDCTPPAVSKSKKVNDLSDVGQVVDVDFINNTSHLGVGWRNVFMDQEVGVAYFLVSLSTFPGGEDIVPFSLFNLSSTTGEILLQGLTLEPNVKYYSNVRAFNHAGMHTTVSSDGVLVDIERPTAGVVQDGFGLHDADYQNNSCTVAATWHGFSDLQSFIHHYTCCFGTAPGTDDVWPCEDVGLRLSLTREIPCTLQNGTMYYTTVYAVDAAGLRSPPAVSDGVTVDTTAPVPLDKFNFGTNLLFNPSFEDVQSVGTGGLPASWLVSGIANISSPSQATSQDGRRYLLLLGSVSQAISTIPGERYRITFHASPIFTSNTPILSQEGYVQAPGMHRVFKLYQRPSHLEGTQLHLDTNITWHQHVFYFTAVHIVSNITVGSVGVWNGIALDNVQVQIMQLGPQHSSADPNFPARETSPVRLHTRFVHGWTSVHAAWHFVDPESPIIDYSWAIGTARGGTQLQTFRSVGRNTHAQNSHIRLDHGAFIHVTVVAENAVELKTVVYSDPVLVDLTPPVISDVKDGSQLEDLDYQNTSVISLYWDVRDKESGVDFCDWTIGLSPGSGELQPFVRLPSVHVLHAVSDLGGNLTHGQTVFPTVRCTNHAGVSSHVTSDGVTIVLQPPDSNHAIVETMSSSSSYYPIRGQHQAATDVIHVTWSGFFDESGIHHYQVRVFSQDGPDFPWTDVGLYRKNHVILSGLHLRSYNTYQVQVRAVNHVGVVSDVASSDIVIETEEPHLVDPTLRSWWPQPSVLQFDWTDVFVSNSSLVYEVSVGTYPGGCDVMKWVETEETQISMNDVDNNKEHFVVITAINQAGLYLGETFVLSYPTNG